MFVELESNNNLYHFPSLLDARVGIRPPLIVTSTSSGTIQFWDFSVSKNDKECLLKSTRVPGASSRLTCICLASILLEVDHKDLIDTSSKSKKKFMLGTSREHDDHISEESMSKRRKKHRGAK